MNKSFISRSCGARAGTAGAPVGDFGRCVLLAGPLTACRSCIFERPEEVWVEHYIALRKSRGGTSATLRSVREV